MFLVVYKQDLTVRPILNELHKLHYSPRLINLQSTMKILVLVAGCCFLSYLSVVPRNAVVTEYNRMFKENLLRVGLSIIWPSILLWLIYGGKHAGTWLNILGISIVFFVTPNTFFIIEMYLFFPLF